MKEHSQGPERKDVTDLTIAEITEKTMLDIAQSMADELPLSALHDQLSSVQTEIQQRELAIALMQEEVAALNWRREQIARAIQLAQDKNPGV